MRRPWAAIFLTILLFARAIAAQSPALNEPRSPGRVEGLRGDPAPPLAPEVIARDADGQATVRAIKLDVAAARRRQARRGGLSARAAVRRLHPGGAALRRAADRADRRLGDVRQREHLRVVPLLGLGAAGQVDRQRAAPRHRRSCARTTVRRHASTPSTIAATASSSTPTRSARAPTTRSSTKASSNTDWNPVWDVEDRPLRGRLDGRDGDPVQVAALPVRARPGLGHPDAPRRSAARTNGRYLTPVPQILGGPAGVQPHLGRRHAGRPRPAAGRQEPRAQAVRDLAADDRSAPDARRSRNDLDRRSRRRREVRRHREPDRRLHRQHRLRAGGGRRAAGEPDAVQPVLPGEARVLPRGARHLRLRRAAASPARQPAPAAADTAVSVLQPPHRPEPRPRHPDRRRRPADRQGRQVRRRR